MKYIDSNITFNDVGPFVFPMGTKIAPSEYNVSEEDLYNDEYILTLDQMGGKYGFGAINAINIDWNGADVNGANIKTTGQLLSIVKDLQDKQDTIATFIKNIMNS